MNKPGCEDYLEEVSDKKSKTERVEIREVWLVLVGMERVQMEVVRNGKSESARSRDGRQEDSSRVGGRGEISGKGEEENERTN